jgi:hypothetical protein
MQSIRTKNPIYVLAALLITAAMFAGMVGLSQTTDFTPFAADSGGDVEATEAADAESGADEVLSVTNVSYAAAERAFFAELMSGYGDFAGLFNAATNGGEEITMTLTPEEYVGSLLGVELNPTQLTLSSFVGDASVFTGLTHTNMTSDGPKEVLDLELLMSGSEMIMSVPQLFDRYLVADMSDLDADFADFGNTFSLTNMMFQMPSQRAVNAVVNAAVDAYLAAVEPVVLETDARVGFGVELSCERVAVQITDAVVMDVTLAMLKAVRENSELMRMVRDMGVSVSEMNAMIETVETLGEFVEGEVIADMMVWIHGSDIVRREIRLDDVKFTTQNFTNGNDYFTALEIVADGMSFNIRDSGTKSGDKATGSVSVLLGVAGQSFEFTAEYTDLKVDTLGNISGGKIKISSNLGFSADLEFDENSFKGSVKMSGLRVATLEVSRNRDYAGVDFPRMTSDNSLNLATATEREGQALMESATAGLEQIEADFETYGYDVLGYVLVEMVGIDTIIEYLGMGMGGWEDSDGNPQTGS